MKYGVTVPIAGMAYIEVEAENEEDARQEALSSVCIDDIEEWDCYRVICEGNVLYTPCNSIEIVEIN